jgi:hypothetical protein
MAMFTVPLVQSGAQLPLAIDDFFCKIVLLLNDEIPGCFDRFRHRNLRMDQYTRLRQRKEGSVSLIGSEVTGCEPDLEFVSAKASLEWKLKRNLMDQSIIFLDDQVEYAQLGASRNKLQSFGDSRVGFVVGMALVPCLVAGKIIPISHEPDFVGHVLRAENIESHKSRRIIHQVRTKKEGLLDLRSHAVGNHEPAEHANQMGPLKKS